MARDRIKKRRNFQRVRRKFYRQIRQIIGILGVKLYKI